MEKKLVRVPFDVELAKKIQNKEIEGRIVTHNGRNVRIVDFDLKEEGCPLLVIAENSNGGELYYSCAPDGKVERGNDSISDIMLEIPEYLTFKDGDILSNGYGFVFILDGHGDCKTSLYVAIRKNGNLTFGGAAHVNDINLFRLATEEEKKKFIDALKASKDPRAKEYLKRFFGIEQKKEYEFKPKGWVLCYSDGWNLCQFSHTKLRDVDNKLMYVTVGGIAYEKCIPYNEQTAHLLGSTDKWEE